MDKLSYTLEGFEGPLDLLLQLISKHKYDIYNVPLAALCDQYVAQIEAMQAVDLDVASEFLEMAARLVYLKTVSLLPRHEEADELGRELTGELLEYQTCREMAAKLAGMTDGFGRFVRPPEPVEPDKTYTGRMPAEKLLNGYLNAVGDSAVCRHLPPFFPRLWPRKSYRCLPASSMCCGAFSGAAKRNSAPFSQPPGAVRRPSPPFWPSSNSSRPGVSGWRATGRTPRYI